LVKITRGRKEGEYTTTVLSAVRFASLKEPGREGGRKGGRKGGSKGREAVRRLWFDLMTDRPPLPSFLPPSLSSYRPAF